MHLLQIDWDPIKSLDLGFFELHFYSVMWIIAFVLGLYVTKRIWKNENLTSDSLDSLFIYSVLGIMIGARLGHVIFYQSELFKDDFFSIFLPFSFKDGIRFTGFAGLASHGAAIGMIIAMYLYNKRVLKKSLLWILDRVVMATALGAIFVRIGNFINSEIVGTKTDSALGVIFRQNGESFARHPAQLYEAFCYIFVFLILMYFYWKTNKSKQEGFLFGLFLVFLWTIRFFIEFIKEAQVEGRDDYVWFMNTGQVLSVPFILIGLYFMFLYRPKKIVE
ncbi:prolipoprotein diacylglyceryl transferase [Winogradskyella sp.]|uniref:prolipoprotein diacylglyceryl transferase n=1 Tax=Winogradskyella sp. TaxID=1883156 RepID=UPI00323960E1